MIGVLISFIIGTLFGLFVTALMCADELRDKCEEAYEKGYADGVKSCKVGAGDESERLS